MIKHSSEEPASLTADQLHPAAQVKRNQARSLMHDLGHMPSMRPAALSVDSSLLAGSGGASMLLSPAWLSACTALLGVPSSHVALVAALNSTMQVTRSACMFQCIHVVCACALSGPYSVAIGLAGD